jgi:DNA-binding MurR/RpiR family transcriptional regulator
MGITGKRTLLAELAETPPEMEPRATSRELARVADVSESTAGRWPRSL